MRTTRSGPVTRRWPCRTRYVRFPKKHDATSALRCRCAPVCIRVRTIGNDLTMDYDAIGQTTHLASRMEQLALPGSIRMTADTLRLAEGLVQVSPLGPIPVKGLVQPIAVFELIGAAAVRSRLQASAVARL